VCGVGVAESTSVSDNATKTKDEQRRRKVFYQQLSDVATEEAQDLLQSLIMQKRGKATEISSAAQEW
jgi:predicted nucleic acid-binding OB-fold protein